MNPVKFLALAACALVGASQAVAAETLVKLYCAAKVVQVDERTFADMKKAFGPDVCTFGEFSTRQAAEKHSEVFGGLGAKCTCR